MLSFTGAAPFVTVMAHTQWSGSPSDTIHSCRGWLVLPTQSGPAHNDRCGYKQLLLPAPTKKNFSLLSGAAMRKSIILPSLLVRIREVHWWDAVNWQQL